MKFLYSGKDKWHNERIPSSTRAEKNHGVASVDSPGKWMERLLYVSVVHESLVPPVYDLSYLFAV